MRKVRRQQTQTQSGHLVTAAKREEATRQPAQVLHALLARQQAMGNQAVQRMLRSGLIQLKATSNEAWGEFEQEADQVAERAMRTLEPGSTERTMVTQQAQGKGVQRMWAECEEEQRGQTQGVQLQRMSRQCAEKLYRQPERRREETFRAGVIPCPGPEGTPGLDADMSAIREGGQSLPKSMRALFEPRFGYDFSQVRIHTDAAAAKSARALNAHAYTVDQNIVFGLGKYAPDTSAGRRLLAHELTHVLQQRNTASLSTEIIGSSRGHEPASGRRPESCVVGQVEPATLKKSSFPTVQCSSDSSGSSSEGQTGSAWPTPVRDRDGTCQCRMDLCWRPIQLWYVPGYFKHGFINIVDNECRLHNLYVDPGQHGGHSHALDRTPGWDTSGEGCISLHPRRLPTMSFIPGRSIPSSSDTLCAVVERLPAATARYESLDVAYDPTDGPNSNSSLEWMLYEATGMHFRAPHGGLVAWDYYNDNPGHRRSPPRFRRPPLMPRGGTAVPVGARP